MNFENSETHNPNEELDQEKEKPVRGEGFTMTPQHAPSRKRSTPEKISPGELERTKSFTPADWAKNAWDSMLERNTAYSETFKILPNGSFDMKERLDGSLLYMTEANNPTELYQLAQTIQEKCPEYELSFETDPEGRWIKYTVSKHTKIHE